MKPEKINPFRVSFSSETKEKLDLKFEGKTQKARIKQPAGWWEEEKKWKAPPTQNFHFLGDASTSTCRTEPRRR
jgi:hypothetical protein